MKTNSLENHVARLRLLWEQNRPEGVPDKVTYPIGLQTIPAHVSHWAELRPQTSALIFEGRDYSYAALDEDHRRVAAWLLAQGVSPGDRVAIYLGNSPEFLISFLAVLRIGAIHVPVNPMFAVAELEHELGDCKPTLVITSQKLIANVEAVQPKLAFDLKVRTVESDWQEALKYAPYARDDGDIDAVAALNYTGGTTGLPKGCQHTQLEMLYTVASTATGTGLRTDGSYVGLCYLPIFWIAGENVGILFPLVLGGTVVMLARWDAGKVVDLIERHRVYTMLGPVENYLEIIEREDISARDLSAFRDPTTVSFMRKLTPEVRAQWAEATNAGVLRESSFGMTETHTMDTTCFGLHEGDLDLRSEPVFCGLPMPGTDIATVEFGTMNPVPIGEVGEVIVRSPSVTKGYWNNPEATAEQIVEGWIRTGDNGRIDERGMLHYLGRRKEMIKVKGMSVFPAEIEMLLNHHPGVGMVAVVPVDDAVNGQRPVAFVIRIEGAELSAEALEQWSRENMASYKVPQVKIVESMPLTASGKVRKVELQEQAAQMQADAEV